MSSTPDKVEHCWHPVAYKCRGYCIIGRNYDLEQPDRVLQEFEDTIFGQDQRIVESQRPEQVPFDLASELHLKFDAVAIAYREAMQAEGLAYGAEDPNADPNADDE